jgi:hypothetical protein
VAAWLGVSLRQHVYSLPSLCMALSMASSSGGDSSSGQPRPLLGASPAVLLAPAALLLAAWGSQHAERAKRASGLAPWACISVAEGAAVLAVAHGILILVRAAIRLSLQLAGLVAGRICLRSGSRGVPARAGAAGALALWAAAAVGAAAVHPSLAMLAGLLRLWLALAATAARCSRGREGGRLGGAEEAKRRGAAGPAEPAEPPSCMAPADSHPLAQPGAGDTLGWRGRQPPGAGPGEGLLAALPAAAAAAAVAGEASGASHSQDPSGLVSRLQGSSTHQHPSAGISSSHLQAMAWERGAECLAQYSLVGLLAAPGLVAWLHSAHRAGLGRGLTPEAVSLVLMGLHACWVAQQVRMVLLPQLVLKKQILILHCPTWLSPWCPVHSFWTLPPFSCHGPTQGIQQLGRQACTPNCQRRGA